MHDRSAIIGTRERPDYLVAAIEAEIAREGVVAAGQPGSGVAIRPQASRSNNCQPRERGSGLRGSRSRRGDYPHSDLVLLWHPEPGMYDPKNILNVKETEMDDGGPRPHSYMQVYIDDVIIVTASQETHVRAWEHFIKVLEYERLAMTEPKIEVGVKYLRYLGHIISHTEVFSDPKNAGPPSLRLQPHTHSHSSPTANKLLF